jgi:heat shock protein HslJ
MRVFRLITVVFALAGCQSTPPVGVDNPLVGTAWLAWDINGSGPGDKTYATLVFNPGRVSGSSGCNRFSGVLEVKAEAWQASDIALTRMECAPELMKEEASFIGALEAARSHKIEGGVLTLLDESGAPRLRLVHLPRPSAQPGFIGPSFVRGLPPG